MITFKHILISIGILLFARGHAYHTYTVSPIMMAAADLKKVHSYYKANPKLTVETNYMAFDEHFVSNLKESKNGLFTKNENSYYSKILDVETLCSGNMIINIDHDDQHIVIGDNDQMDENPFTRNLDSLLLICTGVEYKNINPVERLYSIDFSDNDYSEYDRVDLVIDIKNNRFTKIVLYYRAAMNLTSNYEGEEKQPRMEINYRNYRNSVVNNALLEKDNYITESNGKILAAGKYKKYKILDQRKKVRIKEFKNKK